MIGLTMCRQVFSLRVEPWNVAHQRECRSDGIRKEKFFRRCRRPTKFLINSNFYEAQDLLNNSRLNMNPQVVTKHRCSLLTHLKLKLIAEPSVTNQQFV